MNTRVIELIVAAFSFAVVGIIWGVELHKQYTEPVIVTQNVTEYVDRVVIKEVPYLVVFPVETSFVSYATSQPSLNEVLSILESGKKNHQFYIDNPEKQNGVTGNTSFNELWVNNYIAIASYLRKISEPD